MTNVSTLAPAALLVAVGQRVIWSALFTLLADISVPEERDRWYRLSAAQSAGFGAAPSRGLWWPPVASKAITWRSPLTP